MRDRLPPLFSLQVFESAARLQSFSKAATELSLTPGAISRQIKLLEEWCSQTLFERHGPRINLSKEGIQLLRRLKEPLSALHEAIYPPDSNSPQVLQISTLASIAKSWLLPRLRNFQMRSPHISLAVHTDYALLRPAPRIALVLLRYGKPPSEVDGEMSCEVLFDDHLIAVASPGSSAIRGENALDWSPKILLTHQAVNASTWFKAAGLSDKFQSQGIVFNDADVLLDAAENALGIAITRLSLALPRLKSGALALASKVSVPTDRSNLLLYRHDCADLPSVKAFVGWIQEEASQWRSELRCTLEDLLANA